MQSLHGSIPACAGEPNPVGYQSLAAAATVNVPTFGSTFSFTGSGSISTLNGISGGRRLVLTFAAASSVTLQNGGNISLVSSPWSPSPGAFIELWYDSANSVWVETWRRDGGNIRAGGFISNVAATSGYNLDTTGSAVALAAGASITLPTGSGLITLNDPVTGATALFLLGGGNISLVGQAGSEFAATSTPTSSQIGVYWTGTAYAVKSGLTTATTLNFGGLKIRSAN